MWCLKTRQQGLGLIPSGEREVSKGIQLIGRGKVIFIETVNFLFFKIGFHCAAQPATYLPHPPSS